MRRESSLDTLDIENQCFNDALVSSVAARVFQRIYDWRGRVPAAEVKKPTMQVWTHIES